MPSMTQSRRCDVQSDKTGGQTLNKRCGAGARRGWPSVQQKGSRRKEDAQLGPFQQPSFRRPPGSGLAAEQARYGSETAPAHYTAQASMQCDDMARARAAARRRARPGPVGQVRSGQARSAGSSESDHGESINNKKGRAQKGTAATAFASH